MRPWKWAGLGLALASMQSSAGRNERLYLLRAKPGVKLPRHGHAGVERIVLLHGGFSDEGRSYHCGDLIENDERTTHQPIASLDDTCICLIATEGPLRLTGVGRWLQPYLGI